MRGACDMRQTLCLIQSILVSAESPWQGLSESVFRFEKYRSVPKLDQNVLLLQNCILRSFKLFEKF